MARTRISLLRQFLKKLGEGLAETGDFVGPARRDQAPPSLAEQISGSQQNEPRPINHINTQGRVLASLPARRMSLEAAMTPRSSAAATQSKWG